MSGPVHLGPDAPHWHRIGRFLGQAGVRGGPLYRRLLFGGWEARPRVRIGDWTLPLDPADRNARAMYQGTYERPELALMRSLVSRGDVTVDVGANIGWYTLVLAHLVGPTGRVFAFEPSPGLADRIRHVVTEYSLSWVGVYETALGATSGRATLATPVGDTGQASLRADARVEGASLADVVTSSLDEVLPLADDLPIALVKVDTEGWEEQVLAGARRTVAPDRLRSLLIEVSPEFGPTTYIRSLVDDWAPSHRAFVVRWRGGLRARPALLPVTGEDLGRLGAQENVLVVARTHASRVGRWVVGHD